MKNAKILIPLIMTMILLTACGGSQPEQAAVETQVAALISQQATAGAAGVAPQATVAGAEGLPSDLPTVDPLLPPLPDDANCTPDNSPRVMAVVTDVWSGDSIQVNINGQSFEVRYIGIDAGDLPSDTNRQLVEGKNVLLITDTTDVDEHGRLIRYVIADGVFVNLELLRRNAAYLSFEAPDLACEQVFTEAQP